MIVAQAILWKYPQADPLRDFKVDMIDGQQTITIWRLSDKEPTQTEINDWWLESVREKKRQELSKACQETILAGFVGTNGHSYQFDFKDQDNIGQQLTLMLLDPTITSVDWKTKDAGIVTHTRDEFIQVAKDADAHKRGFFAKYWQLEASLDSYTDENDIKSLSWS